MLANNISNKFKYGGTLSLVLKLDHGTLKSNYPLEVLDLNKNTFYALRALLSSNELK